MREPVDYIFPPVTTGAVPYWRLVLRGCSQLCFQSNELTGVFFFVAVLVASPISFIYLLVAGIMAPAGRMLMGVNGGQDPRKDGGAKFFGMTFADGLAAPYRRPLGGNQGPGGKRCQRRKPPEAGAEGPR